MLFKDTYITDAGSRLFARATAQEGKLIWTMAATSDLDAESYSDAQMNALDTESFGNLTSSGAVINAIVDDSQSSVNIYCEVTNAQHDGEAKVFGAWAKIEGDEGDVLVIVARCGGATPTVINPASDGMVKAFVDYTLRISAEQAQAVQVGEGYYATAAALECEQDAREALAARVVTTHIAGDETTGEAQIIRGKKTFYDQVNCEGFFASNYGAHFDDNVTSNGDFIMSANLYPGEQSTAYVGTAEKAFTGGYFDNLYVNANGVFEVSGSTKIKGVATFNRTVVFSGDVSIDSDLECTDVNVSGSLSVSGTVTVDGIALLKNKVRISGDSSVTGSLAVNGVIIANSGITGNLNGLIPFPTSALDTVPIGSIVLLRILYQSQQSGVQQYGAILTTDDPSYTLGVSCFSETGINANNITALASGQTFRTLSGSVFSGSQASHALAIRVS